MKARTIRVRPEAPKITKEEELSWLERFNQRPTITPGRATAPFLNDRAAPVVYEQGSPLNYIHDYAYFLCEAEYDIRSMTYRVAYRFSGIAVEARFPEEELRSLRRDVYEAFRDAISWPTGGVLLEKRRELRKFFTSPPLLLRDLLEEGTFRVA